MLIQQGEEPGSAIRWHRGPCCITSYHITDTHGEKASRHDLFMSPEKPVGEGANSARYHRPILGLVCSYEAST